MEEVTILNQSNVVTPEAPHVEAVSDGKPRHPSDIMFETVQKGAKLEGVNFVKWLMEHRKNSKGMSIEDCCYTAFLNGVNLGAVSILKMVYTPIPTPNDLHPESNIIGVNPEPVEIKDEQA